jgi:regulator of sirC expression with transglutaminase-like and TPR domain
MIEALVTLLGRESKTANLAIIRARLLDVGAEALPVLDHARRTTANGAGGDAIAAVTLEIRRRLLGVEWVQWASSPDADLETGALLINRFDDPLLDPSVVRRTLDDLAGTLRRRVVGRSGPDAVIPALTAYLFNELEFRGNTEAYDEPENSYLARVLERRLGIPVSLSVVVLLIARRLRLPIVGIGMPGHFIVRYGTRASGPYLDAFGKGKILTRGDCADWLRASGFEFDPRMLRPVDSRYIVARMLRNLVAVFAKRGAASESDMLSGYLRTVVGSSAPIKAAKRCDAAPESPPG